MSRLKWIAPQPPPRIFYIPLHPQHLYIAFYYYDYNEAKIYLMDTLVQCPACVSLNAEHMVEENMVIRDIKHIMGIV